MCKKVGWHRIEKCEDTDEIEARRFKRLKSDLFKKRECELPTIQKASMIRNSNQQFFRLPPEIRLRIYALVLGGQNLWIGHVHEQRKWNWEENPSEKKFFSPKKERFHRGGEFFHVKRGDSSDSTLDLRLLRTCRHVYTETALLPYSLNTFAFQDDAVRKQFEKSARAGKKRVQKQAVGKFEIMQRAEFQIEEWQK